MGDSYIAPASGAVTMIEANCPRLLKGDKTIGTMLHTFNIAPPFTQGYGHVGG